MSYPALDIARKLIQLAEDQFRFGGEKLTNMKLQKLMYYAQGYHLAAFGERLFDDDIESWMYGPVVPSVYDYYAKYEANPLPSEECGLKMTKAAENLFNYVYNFFRNFSAIGLMNRTHTESPWLEALPHNRGTKISNDSIKAYFQTQLPDLLRESISKDIDAFASLPEGWDVYGSPVPSAVSVQRCREILGGLSIGALIYGEVRPTGLGAMHLVFRDGDKKMGITTGDTCFSWYCQLIPKTRPDGESFVEYSNESISRVLQKVKEVYG